MEPRQPREFVLEIFADPANFKDVVRGVLHLIFFHRYFPSIRPGSLEILDVTLPIVTDPELDSLINTRVAEFARQLPSAASPNGNIRGQIAVQFFERKRRKGGGLGWFGGKGEEEVCWEVWVLEATLATPRTEADRTKVLNAMETTLQKAALKVITTVNAHKDHIPPITTSESNPFPYQIQLNPKSEGWSNRISIF